MGQVGPGEKNDWHVLWADSLQAVLRAVSFIHVHFEYFTFLIYQTNLPGN